MANLNQEQVSSVSGARPLLPASLDCAQRAISIWQFSLAARHCDSASRSASSVETAQPVPEPLPSPIASASQASWSQPTSARSEPPHAWH